VQVFGLYEDEELLWVGATRDPLSLRLSSIKCNAGRYGRDIDAYIHEHEPDLEIRELDDYDKLQDALDDLAEHTLNMKYKARKHRKKDLSDYTDELLMDIGTNSDVAVAEEHNVGTHKVLKARKKLGIRPYYRTE